MKTNYPILRPRLIALTALVLTPALAAAQAKNEEKLPPGTKLIRIEAHPATITLKHPFDYSQLLLTGRLDNGDQIDVTRMARIEKPADLVKVSAAGQVRPVADGSGELKCSVADQAVTVPVKVSGQKDKYAVSFVRDVMPTLSKVGCNAGTCHGAQQGKNGFKLSLRGYDPLFDHGSLTDDLEGRRFNRAAPDRSLMLLKPAGGVPHVGGVLFQPGDPPYELIRLWIAEGVKLDLDSPRVTRIDIQPKSPVVPLPGMKQQMAVVATYSDGSVRDVSAEAFIESSNTEIATVDRNGLVTAVRRGEATMLARYEGSYTAATLIVMGDRSGFAWKDVPQNNFIDTLVYEKLKAVKVLPSDLCGDADFIRRVYLDLTGLPPQPEEVRAFLADQRDTRVKRDELIDKLVGGPEFVEHWTNKWADLLQVNRKFLGEKGAAALRAWIKQAVAGNMPYDKFVYAILTGSGSTLDNPPAAYHKILRDPGSAMENTTQLFLAIRFNCNKCHDHPFERWTQDQYYHLAAYFAQVGRKEDPKFKGQKIGGTAVMGSLPLVEIISDQNAGEVKHERTGMVTPPSFPYNVWQVANLPADSGQVADLPHSSRREQLARWVTSKDNPYFAKSYVNRLWSYLLGVGIIEPVDDIRAGNPPSNPKLLDRLTGEFVAHGFDTQHVLRTICKSRTYQHALATNKWNADDEINYSHALARRLPAEVLYDAVQRATGSTSRLPGLPPGARAAQLLDSNVAVPGSFLELFGRPPRESACECERYAGMMLGPVLNLVNGPVIADAIKDPENRISKLVAAEKDDAKVVEELFLAILCRPPTERERAAGIKALSGNDEERARQEAEYNRRVAALAAYEKELPAHQAAWEKGLKKALTWTVLEPANATSKAGATLTKQPDGSVLASGKNAAPDSYTVTAHTDLKGITGIRLEVLSDPSLPANGPGRAPNGNFVLNEFTVTAAPQDDPAKAKPLTLRKPVASFSQEGFAIAGAIDKNPSTGWAIAPQSGKTHVALFEVKEVINNANGTTLTFTLDQQYPGKEHNIGRLRLSVTTAKPPFSLDGPPEAVAKILAVEPEKRTESQKAELTRYFRSIDPELARLTQAVAEQGKPGDPRLIGAQDLAWALLNSPAFLFNH
jgi:hypothetical protein